MMIIPTKVVSTKPAFSKKPSNLSMYMPKRVGDREQPCLTYISHIISSNKSLYHIVGKMILKVNTEFPCHNL